MDAGRAMGAQPRSSQENRKAGQEEFSSSGPEVPGAASFQHTGWKDQAPTFPLLHQIHARK